jgi:hypothetical protein
VTKPRRCKDCGPDSKRPAPHIGPRCATHARQWRQRNSAIAHERRLESNFGITADEYWELYERQGGRCAICRIANGRARRLAVDHDHSTGQIAGILCGPCNIMLGRLGRSADAYLRVLEYLYNPPAIEVLGCRVVPSTAVPVHRNTPAPDGAKPTTTDGGERATR